MKKITILLICVGLATSLKSQNSQTQYDTCSQLRVREGEWIYANGQDTIRIYLRYHRSYDANLNYLSDALLGWHEYKNGNTIIQSNYADRFMALFFDEEQFDILKSSVWLTFNIGDLDLPVEERKMNGFMLDNDYDNKSHFVDVSFNNHLGVLVMIWKQRFRGFYGTVEGAKPFTMTLPQVFALTKQ